MTVQKVHHFPQAILGLCRFHGFWPKDNVRMGLSDYVKVNLTYSLTVWFPFGNLIYLSRCFGNPYVDVTDNIMMLIESACLYYLFCASLLIINAAVLYVSDLENFQKFGEPKNLEKFTKEHNNIMKLFYGYYILAMLLYSIVSYYEGMVCEEKNRIENKENMCGFIIAIWLPFNVKNVIIKNVLFVAEALCILIIIAPAIVGTYFGVAIIDMITIRIKHLKSVLQTIPDLPKEIQKRRIRWCIKYHIRITRLTEDFNRTFGHLSAAHFTFSSVILGILNHQILNELELKPALHSLGWIFHLLLMCHAGQALINESISISTTLYFLNWYDYDSELKLYIRMMIMRSQKVLSIRTGIFHAYSFEFLLAILQASYTYMTVMNQLDNVAN